MFPLLPFHLFLHITYTCYSVAYYRFLVFCATIRRDLISIWWFPLWKNNISRSSTKSKTSGVGFAIIQHNLFKQRRQEKFDKNKNIKKQSYILYQLENGTEMIIQNVFICVVFVETKPESNSGKRRKVLCPPQTKKNFGIYTFW